MLIDIGLLRINLENKTVRHFERSHGNSDYYGEPVVFQELDSLFTYLWNTWKEEGERNLRSKFRDLMKCW